MALTPLKNLHLSSKLSPKLLSPLKPFSVDLKENQENIRTNLKSCSKSLKFPSPKNQNLLRSENFLSPNIYKPNFKVNKNNLLINSPNKLNFLKDEILGESLYEILGKGSFGTVIKAKYKNKSVAVKIVTLEKNSKVLPEHNALNFSHKNIIKIIDIIENNKYGLILMEYYDNYQQLQTILENTNNYKLSENIVKKFARDICSGIDYCHKNNVLHLDIKPKNILLCDNVCKICDFGNSLQISNNSNEKYEFKGTVVYAAPELLLGKFPTKKCDIYSFGIVLWQLKSREIPYNNLNSECIIYKVVKFNLRPFVANYDEKLDEYTQLFCACWQANPETRPNTSEILQRLK